MRSRWSPSALQTLDQCPRRFALREAGWEPRPDPIRPAAPHADFGRVWHAAAEHFDHQMFVGDTREQATDFALNVALCATWTGGDGVGGGGEPLWGIAAHQWRCDGGKVPSDKTGRPVQCPASKGWWVGGRASECSRCGGPVLYRHAYLAHHPSKNRANLLRAVLDYCDEALPGVAADKSGTGPALEMELDFSLAGVDLHCRLDRYTELGGTMRVAHERKSSSVSPHWDGYLQTFQVRLYPEALRQNGLRCDGVLMEHYQILAGGTQRSTVTLTPGPDLISEAAEGILRAVNVAEAYDGHDPLDWPARFSACAHAAGGRPCEYLKVCKASFARRPELLQSEFQQVEKRT